MARLEAAEATIAEQAKTIVELRARLNQDSQDSSRPPSSDLPGSRAPQPKRGKRRKRGGQPGHIGRLAAEPERVDEVKQYRATLCKHCDGDLSQGKPTSSVISDYVYECPRSDPSSPTSNAST